MPESTLSLSKTDFGAKVAYFLGYGRGADFGGTAWTTRQQQNLDDSLNSGLSIFYYPPVLPGERSAHGWSFLQPSAELAVAAGVSAILLPADFGGLSGPVILTTPTGQRGEPVRVVGAPMIDQLYAEVDGQTGTARCVAIRPLKGTGTHTGQRFELAVYPTAEEATVFKVAYTIVPNALTAANPYPYGGPVHSETLLEACLSVAESRQDDSLGVHKALFMERLQASVSHDRKFRAQMLGYNGDGPRHRLGSYQYDNRLVTLDGQFST